MATPSNTSNAMPTEEHMEAVANLSIEQQLQLAVANTGGTLEERLAAAALALLVARMVKLNEKDQCALFACVKDLSTMKNQEDAEDTMKTILEILEPEGAELSLTPSDELDKVHSRTEHESWLLWISQKIKSARDERGLTQQELSKASGIPQSHISRLEAGRHSPSSKTLNRLASALQIDVGTLTLLSE